jgi:hypothetical protein
MMMMQTQWASKLDPVLKDPMSRGVFLKNVSIVSGANVINHLLSRTLQGWIVTDINAAVTLYRSAPKNDLTLTLTASGTAVVDLFVY